MKFLRNAMKRYGAPEIVVAETMKEIGNINRQEVGRHPNNRAENSYLLFRR